MSDVKGVVEEKPKKRKVAEEDFELGRYLGVIAREDEELFERIRNYAKAEGKRFTEVVHEALKVYDEYLTLRSVDVKSLIAALRLLEMLFKQIVNMMMAVNQYMSSQFFAQQVEILHQLRQQQEQQEQSTVKEKKMQVKEQLMTGVLNLVMSMISTLMSGLMKMQGQSVSMPQVVAPTISPNFGKPKVVRSASEGSST